MRYVKLASKYALRGWSNLKYGLLDLYCDSVEEKVKRLSKFQYDALELVTSAGVSIDDSLMPSGIRRMAEKAVSDRILEFCEKSEGLSDYQKYKYSEAKYTHSLLWSITGDCNLRCKHCYLSAGDNLYGEISFEKCISVMDQMLEANIYTVSLTGGEPLVRKDFWELVDALSERRISISYIYTNGVLLSESFLNKLEARENHPHCFHISFDGVGCHDWLRGVKGVEKKAIDAIKLLKERNYYVAVTTAMHMGNLDFLFKTYELMKALNVDYWKTASISDTGNWRNQKDRSIDIGAVNDEYLKLIEIYCRDNAPMHLRLGSFFECRKNRLDSWSAPNKTGCGSEKQCNEYLCEVSRILPYLLPDGRVLPCITMSGTKMEDIAPNIFDEGQSLEKVLHRSEIDDYCEKTYLDLFENNAECGKCKYRYLCTSCRATALYTGDFYDKDMSACVFNKGGYYKDICDIMSKG